VTRGPATGSTPAGSTEPPGSRKRAGRLLLPALESSHPRATMPPGGPERSGARPRRRSHGISSQAPASLGRYWSAGVRFRDAGSTPASRSRAENRGVSAGSEVSAMPFSATYLASRTAPAGSVSMRRARSRVRSVAPSTWYTSSSWGRSWRASHASASASACALLRLERADLEAAAVKASSRPAEPARRA
jgi:hypothetical protein